VKVLARAFRYQRLLDERRYASISEMAATERIERGYLETLPRLTLLAPDLVETILDGRQALGLGLPCLLELLRPGTSSVRLMRRLGSRPARALRARDTVGYD
jgi:hypothetical protein